MILNRILHLLPFFAVVYAVCKFEADTAAPIRHLSDLRTATPFTFTDTYTVAGCAATPTTATIYYTLNVAGTTYPALAAKTYTLNSVTATGLATWVFPGFTVTRFTPGEQATVTWSVVHAASVVSASYFFFVPTSITLTPQVPPTTTLAPQSTSPTPSQTSTILSQTSSILSQTSPQIITTPTTTTSAVPQTSASTPIAGIVGGIIAGLIVITAILAFTWYKVSARRQMFILHDEPFNHGSGNPFTPGYRAEKNTATEEYEMGHPRSESGGAAIKYPEFSANVDGNY